MFRTLAIAAVLGAMAVPASAASVKVNIAGLDAKAAHAKIVHAAEEACSAALMESATVRYYEMTPCVNDAVAEAEAKYAANEHHYASVQNGR
jgi:UrcA family protein